MRNLNCLSFQIVEKSQTKPKPVQNQSLRVFLLTLTLSGNWTLLTNPVVRQETLRDFLRILFGGFLTQPRANRETSKSVESVIKIRCQPVLFSARSS